MKKSSVSESLLKKMTLVRILDEFETCNRDWRNKGKKRQKQMRKIKTKKKLNKIKKNEKTLTRQKP